MPFDFPEIRTFRLLLREVNPSIVRQLFGQYPDAEISRLLGCRTGADWDFFEQRYRHFETFDKKLSYRNWLLIDARDGGLIGDCGFHNWWIGQHKAELGYGIWDAAYRGKGLMAEAMQEVIRIGFETMGLLQMEAFVNPQNEASVYLLQKFGFKEEPKMSDTRTFALLRQDYTGANP